MRREEVWRGRDAPILRMATAKEKEQIIEEFKTI